MKKLPPIFGRVGRVFGLVLSLAVVAWVLVTQVQRQSVGREYVYGGFDDHFTVGTGSFTFQSNHVDVWNTAGDITLVTPEGTPADIRFRGRQQHLEAGNFRIRYRVEEPGPIEIFCGIETTGESGPSAMEFSVVHQTEGISYRLAGDSRSTSHEKVDASVPNGTNDVKLDDSAGSHEIALRMFPLGQAAIGEIDGRSVVSRSMQWAPGTPYRMVFGARSNGKHVRVHVEAATFDQEERWDLSSFEEKFDGKLINPRRFQVLLADRFSADTRTEMVPGGGVSLFAKTKAWKDVFPAIVVRGKRVPLHGFRWRTWVSVKNMRSAAFFVGVTAASHTVTVPRSFDLGFIDEPTFHGPFMTGQLTGNGKSTYEPYRELAGVETGVLELRYDPSTGIGEAILDGHMLKQSQLDLKPLDEVMFRFGMNMQDADGELNAIVKRMSFESRE